ncbi:hypothetical protein CCR94_20815 [Rhodoblastus sphagnicola]|uniref:Uncharacterized protein n=1 Tax=Rhodoblastus sphagnicola TaxID=333368 RepID=A0A2S6MXN3_9HYPH|nr:hypothetical protein [Rhodoblastus sphagnicola]PPQ27120.1 hypothetical protein CCR94_20815 [Rhodoblastus sphagnicola]
MLSTPLVAREPAETCAVLAEMALKILTAEVAQCTINLAPRTVSLAPRTVNLAPPREGEDFSRQITPPTVLTVILRDSNCTEIKISGRLAELFRHVLRLDVA